MALIQYPECGKENISDSAPACPQCGFAIKEYFDNIKQQEDAAKRLEKRKEDLKEWLDKEYERIDNVSHPRKPYFFDIFMGNAGAACIIAGIAAAVAALCAIGGVILLDIGMILAPAIIGVPCGLFARYVINDTKDKYNLALSKYENWDDFKNRDKERARQIYTNRLADIEKEAEQVAPPSPPPQIIIQPQQSSGLKCPVCGSMRVKRISTLSRAVSVELAGLASSKIGKQYECLNCKHKW